ncbi:hypothetical protein SAMN05421788_102391 [Filimonas lacunae]|uniref:Uncharacterized protein n=1 Tax=Filimonas lacunae TaxID=477680 RepID=A0A173MHM0_9BACT|nr:hypothetical protein FLA_3000 [Filimonas lacunae]SIS96927.1 hypothetical protein SAMN05421788_102391 [Filimonas lacunae]
MIFVSFLEKLTAFVTLFTADGAYLTEFKPIPLIFKLPEFFLLIHLPGYMTY